MTNQNDPQFSARTRHSGSERFVSLPAHEIETFVIQTISEVDSAESLAGLDSESAKQYDKFVEVWQQLSPNEQRKLIPQLVQEVVFDPEPSMIAVTLNWEAVVEFVEALPIPNHLE